METFKSLNAEFFKAIFKVDLFAIPAFASSKIAIKVRLATVLRCRDKVLMLY